MKAPFRLPPAYLRHLREVPRDLVDLDWRVLSRRKPPMWPGSIQFFRETELDEENTRLGARVDSPGEPLFFIGSNTCGLVFALDEAGRVLVLDEIEMETVPLAPDFEKFLRSARGRKTATRRRARRARDSRTVAALVVAPPPFPLPARYPEVVRGFRSYSVRLDFRALGLGAKKEPPGWTGELHLFPLDEVAAANATLLQIAPPKRRAGVYFIGNDTRRLHVALDRSGRVVAFDNTGAEVPFARSFQSLVAAIREPTRAA